MYVSLFFLTVLIFGVRTSPDFHDEEKLVCELGFRLTVTTGKRSVRVRIYPDRF